MAYQHLYLSGTQVWSFYFPNAEKAAAWQEDVMELKDHIADINAGNYNEQEKRSMYEGWLERVKIFEAEFHVVPYDIKRAVNSVERGIGVDVTDWEALEAANAANPEGWNLTTSVGTGYLSLNAGRCVSISLWTTAEGDGSVTIASLIVRRGRSTVPAQAP